MVERYTDRPERRTDSHVRKYSRGARRCDDRPESGGRASMRCFQSFFKHTWRPQQVHQMTMVPTPGSIWDYTYVPPIVNTVCGIIAEPQRSPSPSRSRIPQVDPPSRFEPSKTTEMRHHAGETELGEVQVIATLPTNNVTMSTSPYTGELSCRNGSCKAQRSRVEPRLESPWHRLKTVFLVSVIVAFLLWVIVYTLLDQYQIL